MYSMYDNVFHFHTGTQSVDYIFNLSEYFVVNVWNGSNISIQMWGV